MQLSYTICKHGFHFPSEHPLVVCNHKKEAFIFPIIILLTRNPLKSTGRFIFIIVSRSAAFNIRWVIEMIMTLRLLTFHPLSSINRIQNKTAVVLGISCSDLWVRIRSLFFLLPRFSSKDYKMWTVNTSFYYILWSTDKIWLFFNLRGIYTVISLPFHSSWISLFVTFSYEALRLV